MTSEQVLNHLLPAIAEVKRNIILKVEHNEDICNHSVFDKESLEYFSSEAKSRIEKFSTSLTLRSNNKSFV